MNNWYLYTVIALLLLGTQRFLYKVAAEKQCNSALTTTVFMASVTLLSAAAFMATSDPLGQLSSLLLLALLNSCSFAVATITHIEALKRLPAGITFPLTRLSLVVVICFSLLFLDESLTPLQWLGVLCGFAVVLILARDAKSAGRSQPNFRSGLLLIAVCILCGAVASISSKLAAESVNKAAFMTLSYLFGSVFSLGIEVKWGRRTPAGRTQTAVVLGLVMGGLNFVGFYAFLSALARGPLSAIALITGMHFVIAIVLAVLLYREKMNLQRAFGIGLTLLSVYLLGR